MKTCLFAAAALALMSMTALAEEAVTVTDETPAAGAAVERVALPQSTATEAAPLAVSEPETARGDSYGGCSHRRSTVYLTN